MIQDSFLKLVRLGLGTGSHSAKLSNQGSIDWVALKELADAQGLTAFVLDGLNSLPLSSIDAYGMPLQMKLEWIGEVLQNYEQRYTAYEKAISSLAGFYNHHGYKMMVVKGYACSLNWPIPNHRPCGDIDIWLFGQWKDADETLRQTRGPKFEIDSSHHQHTVFNWKGFTVENHYDFLNVHYGHNSAELENILQELGNQKVERSEFRVDSQLKKCCDDGCKFPTVEVYGEKVYLPSANLHALFLLRHSMTDFAAAVLTLRQVLDWAFFVEKHTKEIDWEWLRGVLAEYKMTDFFNCINAICVGDLGFSPDIFGTVQFDPFLKEKVLNDIIQPAFTRSTEGRGFFGRIVFKYRRWQGNAWKQELCYHDSRWKAFWTGVWNHLLKPKSI